MSCNTWNVELVTPPTVEPTTAELVRADARLIQTSEDASIEAWIKAARMHAEAITKRQLLSARWRLTLDRFPAAAIYLPFPPVLASPAPTVVYDDVESVQQTVSTADYRVLKGEPARLEPITVWPTTRVGSGAVRIEFSAGYGTTAADVPEGIKFPIRWLTCWLIENREAAEIPSAFANLLVPYKHCFDFSRAYE